MYTEPHEFALNIPALMSEARMTSYRGYAWPRWLGRLLDRGPVGMVVLSALAFAVMLVVFLLAPPAESLFGHRSGNGSLYASMSHAAMAAPALVLTALGFLIVVVGLLRFWRDAGGRAVELGNPRIWGTALREAAGLRWLHGGGGDCYYPEEEVPSVSRRRAHHLVMYGFLATFAATVSAAVAEYLLGDEPPYSLLSVPVLLGLLGGVALVWGCVELILLKREATRELATEDARAMDYAFLVALLLVGATGLLVLVLRDSSALGFVLLIHLATVAALYLTAPYGKFLHAVYRFAALLRSAHERSAG
jgi:citrate/tricarballylate utilization protein